MGASGASFLTAAIDVSLQQKRYKRELKKDIENLVDVGEKTIEEVIEVINDANATPCTK